MKVNRSLAIVMRMRPSISEYLTPHLSIIYPEIVSPYPNRKRALTQKRAPASYYVIPNSYWQKTRKVKSSMRNIMEVISLMMKITHISQVIFSMKVSLIFRGAVKVESPSEDSMF